MDAQGWGILIAQLTTGIVAISGAVAAARAGAKVEQLKQASRDKNIQDRIDVKNVDDKLDTIHASTNGNLTRMTGQLETANARIEKLENLFVKLERGPANLMPQVKEVADQALAAAGKEEDGGKRENVSPDK